MTQIGYDNRTTPGYVILTGSSGGEHLTATEAEEVAKKLVEAAKAVRAHNRPTRKLGEY